MPSEPISERAARIDRRLAVLEALYPGTNRVFADRDGEWSLPLLRREIEASLSPSGEGVEADKLVKAIQRLHYKIAQSDRYGMRAKEQISIETRIDVETIISAALSRNDIVEECAKARFDAAYHKAHSKVLGLEQAEASLRSVRKIDRKDALSAIDAYRRDIEAALKQEQSDG